MYWYQREAFLDQQLEGTDFVPRDKRGGGWGGGWGGERDRMREREKEGVTQ